MDLIRLIGLIEFVGSAEDFELGAAVNLVTDLLLVGRERKDESFVQNLLLRNEWILLVEGPVCYYGFLFAISDGSQSLRLNTVLYQVVTYRLRPLF